MQEPIETMHTELEERLKFETLLAEVSSRFVNVTAGEVDREIEDAQRRICESLDLDLLAVWQLSNEAPFVLTLTHYYSVQQGFQPPRLLRQNDFPWFMKQLKAGRFVAISSLEEMPAEAAHDREVCRQLGIKSNLSIPLSVGGEPIIGVLGFNTTRSERGWPDALVKQLQLIGQIFANALARKRFELALRENDERLTLTAESADVGLWVLDCRTRVFWASEKARAIFGYSADQVIDMEHFEASVHPDDWHLVQGSIERALKAGELVNMEYRIRIDHSHTRWIASRGRPYFSSTSQPDRLMGISIDITERKLTEQALQDRLRFERLVSDLSARFVNIPPDRVDAEIESGLRGIIGFFQVDRSGLLRLTGKNSWQITHSASSDTVSPIPAGDDLPRSLYPWIYEKLAEKKEVLSISNIDDLPDEANADRQTCMAWGIRSFVNIPLLTGESVDHVINVNSAKSERAWPEEFIPRLRLLGEIFVNALARRQAEAEVARLRADLLRFERSFHLSELTASLAHELNQPLTAILSNAQAALRFLESGRPDLNEFRDILRDIISDDQRAGNIIRSLRSMMKREEVEKRPIKPHVVLNDVMRIFRSEALLRSVSVEAEWDESLPPVFGDQVQLQQVVLNILMNAAEAMSQAPPEGRKIMVRAEVTDQNIRISARDFGPGISQTDLERVFQPFITTKGSGMGMGLAISNSIIKEHGGRIWAENNQGGGATFFIELPVYGSGR